MKRLVKVVVIVILIVLLFFLANALHRWTHGVNYWRRF